MDDNIFYGFVLIRWQDTAACNIILACIVPKSITCLDTCVCVILSLGSSV